MIMLIGLVTKNGILIVEFANQKRKAGLAKTEAAIEAAAARLRPILMTSLATIFGAMPIALGLGAGAESRMPLGIVVVGGLFFALVLTLFVIPGYVCFDSKKQKAGTRGRRSTADPGAVLTMKNITLYPFSSAHLFIVNAQPVLTIEDAVSIALKNNYDILVAHNDAETAQSK